MSGSNYCFLTCIQVSQESGQVAWYSHLFKTFPQFVVIHSLLWSTVCCDPQVKGFSIVNETEINVLLGFSCFFYDPRFVGNLISGSPAFSKSSLNIWNFSVHILLKPNLENIEHYFVSVWDECTSELQIELLSLSVPESPAVMCISLLGNY